MSIDKANFWHKLNKNKPILALAPMAGVTDSAFRQICKKYGADVVYTEMVSADGLFYDSKKTLEFLNFTKSERPVVIQLFGKNHEKFTKAAKLAEKAGFDGIDINFGCPAKKVAGHGGGVTLMRDLGKCKQIIEATLAGTELPVSVKLRSSINKIVNSKEKVTALDFANYMKDLPISAVMVHGRSYEQPFDGEPDYEMIKAVKDFYKKTKTVVLGNGGIHTPEDGKKMIANTGVDGLGIARGIYGKPWIFKQIKDYLKTGKFKEFTQKQIIKVCVEHAKAAQKDKDDHGLIELRKHLLWYVKGWTNAKELRTELVRVSKISDISKIFK
ncbi:MAG: tRNA-dihydrouridine synthase family protein [Candidatus Buchananbacteria bacterium]